MWGWGRGGGSQNLLLQLFRSFGSTEITPKLAVSLFHETTKTNVFVSDSVETSFGEFSLYRYEPSFVGHPAAPPGIHKLLNLANSSAPSSVLSPISNTPHVEICHEAALVRCQFHLLSPGDQTLLLVQDIMGSFQCLSPSPVLR
jgi:hypothetical protein